MRLLLLLLLLPSLAFAKAEIRIVTARSSAPVGSAVPFDVEITGNVQGNLSIPKVTGLDIRQTMVRSDMEMRRGRMEMKTVISYQAFGDRVGDFVLGPMQANVDGRTVKSNTVTIEFFEGRKPNQRATATPPGMPTPTPVPTEDIEVPQDRIVWARAEVSDRQPFVGEPFLYQVDIGSRSGVRNIGWDPPNFSPLLPEPGVEQRSFDRRRIIDDTQWQIDTVQVPLFAVQAGPVELQPAELNAEVIVRPRGSRPYRREEPFSSNAVVLEARALPREGKPEGFSGAIGQFRLRAQLDRDSVDAGDTATLQIRVQGPGALRGAEPVIQLPQSVRVYDEQPKAVSWLTEDGLVSEVTWRKALVPTKPGPLEIPAVELAYFDPDRERYGVARSQGMRLAVTGEAVAAAVARSDELSSNKEQVELLGSDILPLHTGARLARDHRARLASLPVLGLLVLPLLAFASAAGIRMRNELAGSGGNQRRQRERQAKQAVADGQEAAKSGDLDGADKALRDYLSARLERPGESLSPSDAERALHDAEAPAPVGQALAQLLEQIEGARYGGLDASGVADEVARWLRRAQEDWR